MMCIILLLPVMPAMGQIVPPDDDLDDDVILLQRIGITTGALEDFFTAFINRIIDNTSRITQLNSTVQSFHSGGLSINVTSSTQLNEILTDFDSRITINTSSITDINVRAHQTLVLFDPDNQDFPCGIESSQWNVIDGTVGNDLITGTSGMDWIRADDGNDTINALEGDDCVFGGNGADVVNLGDGNDIAFGEAGDDEINGDDGLDLAHGGNGTDACTAERHVFCESIP